MSTRISNSLLILFLVLMVPSIVVYAYNANHEYHESEESKVDDHFGLIKKTQSLESD